MKAEPNWLSNFSFTSEKHQVLQDLLAKSEKY